MRIKNAKQKPKKKKKNLNKKETKIKQIKKLKDCGGDIDTTSTD